MAKKMTHAKRGTGSVFPERTYDASAGLERVEPLLTAKMLRSRFFFGVPLISPLTKEKLTDSELRDYITRAASQFEVDAQVLITPTLQRHRLPFDPNLYHQHIWTEIPIKPVQKVLRLAICSASYRDTPQQNEQYPSGNEIYVIPEEWVDMSYAPRGRLFINPINPAFSAIGTTTAIAASGATVLQFIGQQGWVPAYWTCECLVGYCSEDGQVPVVVNEAIGAKAAMMVILNLLPLHHVTSHSMGVDGISQSIGDQIWSILKVKFDSLEIHYSHLVNRIKTMTSNKLIASNV